ncbi:MAG: CpaF family protein [Planctomycetota bacterium]|nr:CpaF family protein [Planctomycetota bacterium]
MSRNVGEVLEPTSEELRLAAIRREVQAGLIEVLDPDSALESADEDLRTRSATRVRQLVDRIGRDLDEAARARVAADVVSDAFGLGPLDALLEDDAVTDVLINAPDRIFVERDGTLGPVDVSFRDQTHLMHVIQRLVRRAGRRLDERSPMVDARLPDGARVNIIIPPLALDGPQVSIRRFSRIPFDVERLLRFETLAPATARLLSAAVKGRLNIAITGGAGSGKTTLLNALSGDIASTERVITIEDAAELRLAGVHVVRLETRAANLEGVGEVDPGALVRNALRMRPDRIIVGECRGGEAFDMLQAMNTGHDGSMTTLHANSAGDALFRLESMLAMSGFEAPVPVIREYLASALDLVVHLDRLPGGRRVVGSVSEVRVAADRSVDLVEIHRFRLSGVEDGVGRGEFEATGERPDFLDRIAAKGIQVDDRIFDSGPLGAEETSR